MQWLPGSRVEPRERRILLWGSAALFLAGWADVSVKNVSETLFLKRIGVERRLTTAGTEKSLMDPFRPATPEQQSRLEALLASLHEEFKAWVRGRRSGRLKAEEEALFTGRFWTGREAVGLGLADGFGTLDGEVTRRFGDKARLVPVGAPRRGFPWRLLGGGSLAAEAVEAAFAAAEQRAAWARVGL